MKMIKKITILLALLAALSSCGQSIVPNELITEFDRILANPSESTKYEILEGTPFKYVALPTDFALDSFKDTTVLAQLKNSHIKYITYAYTDFKVDPAFDQAKLNRERLFKLHQHFPSLFDTTETEWKVLEQTSAKSDVEAKEMFHGFVIYYRPAPTKESMESEINFMESKIDEVLNFASPMSDTSTLINVFETKVLFDKSESEIDYTIDEHYVTSEVLTFDYGNYFVDTTVSAVFNRNKDWTKMLINCDLTGSMSPYATQLFLWHKLNLNKNKVQNFVFFNDGNITPDNKKKAGSTGGIYFSQADNFDELKDVAYKCMRSGGGGDAPENDIEAILKGLDRCEDCGDVILIADNWANMRDYQFIDKIDRPIKIILCGTQFGINKQYLDLARATKGSVHTMEDDLSNLMDLKEGEEIAIGNHTFIIKEGKFVEVKKI
jgi:hypothetical protein